MNTKATTPEWKDATRNARQQKRRAELNEKAIELGFDSWGKFETAVINGNVKIEIKE